MFGDIRLMKINITINNFIHYELDLMWSDILDK